MRSVLRRSTACAWFLACIALTGAWAPPVARPIGAKVTVYVVRGDGSASAAGVQLSIVGTSRGAVASAQGRAVFSNVPPGTYQLRARFLGCAPATVTVVVPPTGDVSRTIVICGDAVDAANATTDYFVGLMDLGTDASGTENCADDQLSIGYGTVPAPGNATLTASGTPCHVAVLLLSKEHAPHYVNVPATVAWTPALGDRYVATVAAGTLNVPMRIIVSDPSYASAQPEPYATLLNETIPHGHLGNAKLVFDDSYAGITLVDPDGGDPKVEEATAAVAGMLDGGCQNVELIRATPSIYDAKRLNVYYVARPLNEGGVGAAYAGYTCHMADAPNIIFVSSQLGLPFTLVHEVGHALGLTRPDFGHSDWYTGFYKKADGTRLNIMSETDNLAPLVQYFSVGQVAQMHLGVESWLNRPISGTETIRSLADLGVTPVTSSCVCPETAANPDCPALTVDVERYPLAATKYTGSTAYACGVTPVATTIDVCSTTGVVTKNIGSKAPFPGTGKKELVSLNPSIVKVTLMGTTDASIKGTLTPVSAGTAKIRAYAGGSYTEVTVNVTASRPPCP